jgi:NAD+ diphosphatase
MTFVAGLAPPASPLEHSHWFLFQRAELLVREHGDSSSVADAETISTFSVSTDACLYLGLLDGVGCYTLDLPVEFEAPEGWHLSGLRPLHVRLSKGMFAVAGRAIQLVEWERTHRFCGRCGTRTERSLHERARVCPTCRYTSYPRLSPVVIALIEHGQRVLLIRGRDFPEPFHSTVAGFVEPGESLEEALAREVREEVGVEIVESRYFGSQPWPFPHSLMIGFRATAAGEHLEIDPRELVEAGWFSREHLPRLPSDLSISRWMIDAWINEIR